MTASLHELFDRSIPEPNSGCWIWTGATCSGGYAMLHRRGTKSAVDRAHVLSYQAARGEIPEGFQIDHKCRVRSCVNPDHLEAVTPQVNWERGVSLPAINSRKTHCSRGHEYTADNTIFNLRKNGKPGRRCRTCHNEWSRNKWRQKNDRVTS